MSEVETRMGLVEQVSPEERSLSQIAYAYDLVADKIAGNAELRAAIGVIAEQRTRKSQKICNFGGESLAEIRWNQGFTAGVQTMLTETTNSVEIQKSRDKFTENGKDKEQLDV